MKIIKSSLKQFDFIMIKNPNIFWFQNTTIQKKKTLLEVWQIIIFKKLLFYKLQNQFKLNSTKLVQFSLYFFMLKYSQIKSYIYILYNFF